MKNMLKLSAILSFIIFLAACGSGSDKVTGSASLTDNLAGKYSRQYKKEAEGTIIRDTILIVKKDQNFEVENHRWFFDNLKPEDGYTKVSGFQSFQGVFNQTDTTISHPQGGSMKFNLRTGVLSFVDKPEMLYTKVK
jgi:hypothetical protein